MTTYLLKNESTGVVTGIASLLASFVAGLACIGPLMGIALGIGGLGWLTRFSHLTLPASLLSLTLMSVAILMYKRRKSCCANKRLHQRKRILLIASSVLVLAINAVEFIVLPYLL